MRLRARCYTAPHCKGLDGGRNVRLQACAGCAWTHHCVRPCPGERAGTNGSGCDGDVLWHRVDRHESRRVGPIGRASCRERVCTYVEISVVAVSLKKKLERIHKKLLTPKQH